MTDVICEENSLTEWFLAIPEDLITRDLVKFGTELSKKLLSFKAPCWDYEKEIRILRNGAGRLPIDKSFLRQVCFGLNTPEEDKETIKTIVQNNGYNVTFCKIKRIGTDFGIKAEEI